MKLIRLIGLEGSYLRNIGWQSSGNALAQVIYVLSMPAITRLFGPADFGTLSIFLQCIALTTILVSFRVEQIIMLARTDTRARVLAVFVLNYGAMTFAAMTLIALLLVLLDVVPTPYQPWALLLPLASYFMVFGQAIQQLSQRTADFRRSGISEVVNRTANSMTAIFAGLAGLPSYFLAFAVTVGFFFKALTFLKFLGLIRRNFILAVLLGFRAIRRQALFKLLGSLITSHSLLAMTMIAPLSYIGYRYGADFAGYYSLVLTTLSLPTALIGNAVGQVFYQRASSQFSKGEAFTGLVIGNVKLLAMIAIPSFSFVAVFGPFLYPFVFGPNWQLAGEVARFVAVSVALSFMSVPFDRSGLIVNAWWYGPSWHLARLTSVLLTLFLVDLAEGSFLTLIICLTIQASSLYIVDASASYLFSRRTTPFSSRAAYGTST